MDKISFVYSWLVLFVFWVSLYQIADAQVSKNISNHPFPRSSENRVTQQSDSSAIDQTEINENKIFQKSCDSSCLKQVRGLLNEYAYTNGYISSWAEKASNRLGDSIAGALIQIFPGSKLYERKNVELFLPVIRASFQFPSMIKDPNDREPVNTLLLLNRIIDKATDDSIKQEIDKVRVFIEDRAGLHVKEIKHRLNPLSTESPLR